MRYPKFLKSKGRIGFIAPSFGCSCEPYNLRFDSCIETFREKGYEIVEGPNSRLGEGIGISNTPQKCGEEINDFFTNDRSDIIISCGGGELMCEDMPYVDFEAIKNSEAKWFLGYSDNTNLTFLLATLTDTASIYGPCAAEFGNKPWHPAVEDAYKILCGEKLKFHNYDKWEDPDNSDSEGPLSPFNVTEDYKQIIVGDSKDVSFEGRIIGGCLDVLVLLSGTRFDKVADFLERYREDGFIWYLESCELNVMSIRRALWTLEQTGWFKYLKGFLIGRPLMYKDSFGDFDCHDAVSGILKKYNVPIIMDVDIGHVPPAIPIMNGAYAKVRGKGNELTIEYVLK